MLNYQPIGYIKPKYELKLFHIVGMDTYGIMIDMFDLDQKINYMNALRYYTFGTKEEI